MATRGSTPPHPRSPSIRRSLVLSFAKQYTTLLFAVPTVVILSRLLTPAQVGVYSVAAATITLVHMLRDFGVSEYLVQAHELDDVVARSAFTINLCMAWALAVITFAASPWIGDFYREPGLALVLRVLSINFLLLPFGSTVTALLTRSMQFGILYRVNLAELCVRTSVTIVLAYLGFGYMSPAWGSVTGVAANVIATTIWGHAYRIRGLSLVHWKPVTRFGLQQLVGDIMNRLGYFAPDFVIGRVLGFVAVGLYSRGYGLLNLFQSRIISAIGAVAFPAFAHTHHRARDANKLYLKSTAYITAISLPFAAFAALMAFPIIRIMFGPQWDMAVPILRLLAIAMGVSMLLPQFGEFLTATGKVGVKTLTTTTIQIIRIGLLVPAASYSLNAAAASQILVAMIAVTVKFLVLHKHTQLRGRDLLRTLMPTVGITCAAMALPVVIFIFMPPTSGNVWTSLVLAAMGGGVGWLTAVRILRHPLWTELSGALNRVSGWRRRARNVQG